jgi:poly(3-hydroxybutyrate) depolymerase
MLLSLAICFLFGGTISLADPSPGCNEREIPRRPDGKPSKEFQFQGRDGYISFPPNFRSRKPTSLIVAYHDEDMKPKDFEKVTKFDNPELNRNSIVVYPSTLKVSGIETGETNALTYLQGRWMTDPKSGFKPQEDTWDSQGEDETNDLFYTKALLKHLGKTYCLNTRRVYAVGLGTGGGLIHQLACQTQLSREFAAFAAVAPAVFKGEGESDRFWGQCPLGRRPVPVLGVSGSDDKTYPVYETRRVQSKSVLPAWTWAKNWAEVNHCGEKRDKPSFISPSNVSLFTQYEFGQMAESVVFAGGVTRVAYRCDLGQDFWKQDLWKKDPDLRWTSVLQYIVKGAGHGWIRASFKKGPAHVEYKGHTLKAKGSQNFDSSSVVIGFFNAHRLPSQKVVLDQARNLLIERGAKKYDYSEEAKKHLLQQEKWEEEARLKQERQEKKQENAQQKEL